MAIITETTEEVATEIEIEGTTEAYLTTTGMETVIVIVDEGTVTIYKSAPNNSSF